MCLLWFFFPSALDEGEGLTTKDNIKYNASSLKCFHNTSSSTSNAHLCNFLSLSRLNLGTHRITPWENGRDESRTQDHANANQNDGWVFFISNGFVLIENNSIPPKRGFVDFWVKLITSEDPIQTNAKHLKLCLKPDVYLRVLFEWAFWISFRCHLSYSFDFHGRDFVFLLRKCRIRTNKKTNRILNQDNKI